MSTWAMIAAVLGAYLVGAVPVGFLLVKLLRGQDIRHVGSGNIGATNAGRVLGRWWGLLVWFLDALKGFLPCLIVGHWAGHRWTDYNLPWFVVASGLAAIIGHMFPLYLRFRGGKGVSTSCGVFLYLFPAGFLIATAVWALALAVWRYVSLASILGAIALLISAVTLPPDPFGASACLTAISLLAALLMISRHASNIRRLLAGTESKVGRRRP